MAEHRAEPPAPDIPARLPMIRRLLAWHNGCLALLNAGMGYSYLTGGRANSPTLQLIQDIAPIWVWGVFLMTTGVGILMGQMTDKALWYLVGFGAGVIAWAPYTAASVMTFFNNTALSAGGPWLIGGLGLMHVAGLAGSHGVWRQERAIR